MPSAESIVAYLALNVLVAALLFVPSVLLHELGHAVAARLMGMRFIGVSMGNHGRTLGRVRIGWLTIEWRMFPFDAVTTFCPASLRFYRLRRFITVLAGPLTTTILLGIAIFMVPDGYDWALYARVDGWSMLALANAFILFCNLLPVKTAWQTKGVWSDAMSLLQTPFLSRATIERDHAAFFTLTAIQQFERGDFEGVRRSCNSGLALCPDNPAVRLVLAFAEFYSKDFQSARKQWLLALESPDLEPSLRPSVMINVACSDAVLCEDPASLARADEYSRLAAERRPDSPAIQSSRGEVLIALGKAEQGTAMIWKHIDKVAEPKIKALHYCFLSVGEARLGKHESAKQCRELAQQLDPDCALLDMADREFANVERMNSDVAK